MNVEKIRPTKGRVLVRPKVAVTYVRRNKIVPETVAGQIPPQQGEILRTGDGVEKVCIGDNVLYGLHSGINIGDGLLILNQTAIIGRAP